MDGSAAFAGLAMSYRNGKVIRQDGTKAKRCIRLSMCQFRANFCLARHDLRNIIAPFPAPRYSTSPHQQDDVLDTRKLDAIDLRILAELQADGRITNVELSRRAKITAPPCLRRIRALEKSGFIKGYHAELDGKALGFEVTGFVFVGLASQKDADLKHFEESARRWPEVRECHMLSGEVDFILKCVARDLSAFQSFITDTVTAEKNVASVKSSLVIHASKQEPGYPITVPA
jgi:DNA-binding Lrp family transcriptional regulator